MTIDFINTNIASFSADAIVLPANQHLKEGAGASEAIFEAAGRKKLAKACDEIGFCSIGGAVPTSAFNLDAKYIIHAVVPSWIDGDHNEYEYLCSAYLESLKLADYLKCESIAFPLLASGNNKFDKEMAFEIAVKTIGDFKAKYLNKATIVLFGDRITKMVRSKGIDVPVIPEGLAKDVKKSAMKKKGENLVHEGEEIIENYIDVKINDAIEYFKDPKHIDQALAQAIDIVKYVKKMVDLK